AQAPPVVETEPDPLLAPLAPPKPKRAPPKVAEKEPELAPAPPPPPRLDAKAERKRDELMRLFQELEGEFVRMREIHSCERIGKLCTHIREQLTAKYEQSINDPDRFGELQKLLQEYGQLQSRRRKELGISASP
ncbi:MAG: hypothetical protein ACK4N5_20635, partial [Myxococcales bacterium]